jgi:hypothetical protein
MFCLLLIQITLFITQNWVRLADLRISEAWMIKLYIGSGWNLVEMMDRVE